MEQDLCYPRLGWLDHQRPRVIDRPVPELGEKLAAEHRPPAAAASRPPLNAADADDDEDAVDVMMAVRQPIKEDLPSQDHL